jgi:plasmid stabilization system protein ParE
MAKKIIWSPLAKRKLNEILEFWNEHNKSNSYSLKLTKLFKRGFKINS